MTNPTMTRRALIQRGAVAGVVLTSAGSLVSCNASEWVQIALNDLPVVIQIAESVISIVGAAKGSTDPTAAQQAQLAADTAKQALLTAQSLIQSYQAKADKTTLGKIDAALLAAQSNLSAILATLHIGNTTLQATIAAAIGSALTVIVAVQSLVPPPPVPAPAPVTARRAALHNAKDHKEAMKQAFNEAVTAAGSPQFALQ